MISDFYYLDYNATANMHPEVLSLMTKALDTFWANDSSPHELGRRSLMQVDYARQRVAKLVKCEPRKVRFTSGATESNNWILQSLRLMHAHSQPKTLVSAIEHPSVYELGDLFIPIQNNGIVDLDALENLIIENHDEIAVVSVMAANNETGILQPISDMYQLCKEHKIPFHTDASQVYGKIDLDIDADFITLSAHKMGGPKGIGALIVNQEILPFLKGGPQERESRAGTSNVPSIMAFGLAAEIASQGCISNQLQQKIEAMLENVGATILGKNVPRLPNTTCAIISDIPGDVIVAGFDLKKIYISTGSACSSGSHKQSHVLAAMQCFGSPIRISYGPEYNSPSNEFLSYFENTLHSIIQGSTDENLDDWDFF